MCKFHFTFPTLLLSALTLCTSLPAADDVILAGNTVLASDVHGTLFIRNGAWVEAKDIQVTGDVRIEQGARFAGQGVLIDGNLIAEFAGAVSLETSTVQSSRVAGDVHVHRCNGAIRLIDCQVNGHITLDDNTAPEIDLLRNSTGGNIEVFANQVAGAFNVESNDVSGNVQVAGNTPEPFLQGNIVSGPPADGSLIEVIAVGHEGDESFELRVDQKPVRQWTATRDLRRRRFRAPDVVAPDRLRVVFTNDSLGPNGYDRNLRVDSISIDGVVYQTEDPTVYSSGSPAIGSGFHQTETLFVNGYFQYGITGAEEELIRLSLNSVMPDGWKFKLVNDGTDISLKCYEPDGRSAFKMKFGSAGVISSIQDSRTTRQLLAKSYQGEVTDRVVQWTLWEQGSTAVYDVPSLPFWEDRFNITQAGTYKNVLQGTVAVDLNTVGGQLDVWSDANRLWKSALEPYLQGSVTALTRTNVLDGGALLVRRVIRIGKLTRIGQEISIGNPYFESWNPFSDREFNSLALSIDNLGQPDQWYADSKNIPYYPAWPVASTRGWAMVYHRSRIPRGANVAVVFGRNQGFVHLPNGAVVDTRRFVLNTMDFSGGLAILPGLWPASVPAGTIIDQSYLFVPGHGIQATTAQTLDALSDRLPIPQVYHPGSALPGDLSIIADRLEQVTLEPHTFTNRLGKVK